MAERIEYDILLIGGSPSNLALAHHLVDLAKQSGVSFSMAILEKGKEFGAHILSGAVSKPHVIEKLFPDYKDNGFPYEAVCNQSYFSVLANKSKWDVPAALLPAGLKKEGYLVLTLSHVVYWMANKLKEKLAEAPSVTVDFFPGFSAHEVVYDGDTVVGVQVVEKATGNAEEDNIYGKVTCFGDKGFVSRNLIERFKLRDNPQIWSVGVKEVWELPEGSDYTGKVWHTMGFPLVDGSFGGGFIYGMKDRKLTIGMVISLDSPNPNINPQQRLQDLKKHPWVQSLIQGGKMLKYGAALLPEGGYYSLPKKFSVDGALLLGDALGVLDISQLSGVDKAMECGWQAAEVLHEAIQKSDFSEQKLSSYKERVMNSFVGQNLYEGRYFRQAWQENPRLLNNYLPKVMEGVDAGSAHWGLISVGLTHNPVTAVSDALRLKKLMDGKADIGPVRYIEDYKHIVPNFKTSRAIEVNGFDKDTVYSRADAVFYAGTKYHEENRHIDEFNADVCVKCISTYDTLGKETPCVSDCTAEVHRIDDRGGLRHHGMSLENCVQCRTCEIVCPEVNLKVRPTEEGSGPDFMGL
ncbi:electron-transfer flavoprotein:ubiquinone oxidoreductase [Vampirovibrio chlorellavorus]|uniref:electron-transfer flavoprotein:ubiquinone oxidoreductase n=1 Tax=Vampirovibrio chlorellavorus TaxID=758823 RepID=UPI0026F1E568|nr:electron-transfer flavoprotein:ubiquinone oxidoreductase [Vampirovibrio chlorellavorus]